MTDQTPITPEVTSDDKLWALLSFLLTPLIPLIVILMEDKKNRPFLKHHAVPTLIEGIILWIITIIPVVGWILGPIGFIVINILMGIKAYKGEYVNIPVNYRLGCLVNNHLLIPVK